PPSSPELWECGNLAGCWRDFQGARGKSGKPVFGLSTLSTAPAFPQLFSFAPGFVCEQRAGRGGMAIVDPDLSSFYCSLVGSCLHSSPGCEHGASSDPTTRRSDVLSPAPQSIRRTEDCW